MTSNFLRKNINLVFSNKIRLRVLGIAFLSLFMSLGSFGQSFILNLQDSPMSFTNAQRTVLLDHGHSGTDVGSIHRYDHVVTKNGITVYAKMTILESSNANVTNFDDDVLTGDVNRFQPRIGSSNNNGGYITYQLEFFDTQTNYPVYLYNYYMTGVDDDGNGSNKEYIEVGGYSSYQLGVPTGLTISTNSNNNRTGF